MLPRIRIIKIIKIIIIIIIIIFVGLIQHECARSATLLFSVEARRRDVLLLDRAIATGYHQKSPSLKTSLIGQEEVPRLLGDNAFAFGLGRGSRYAVGKNEQREKSRRDKRGG